MIAVWLRCVAIKLLLCDIAALIMAAHYNRKDHLYKKAKDEGMRSRAAYKLEELNNKHKLIKKGDTVVDLGSFPGGWLLVASKLVGPKGKVAGIDITDIETFTQAELQGGAVPLVFKGDIRDKKIIDELRASISGAVDVVLSDMSPKLTGIKLRDVVMAAELVEEALLFAARVLKPGGHFVAKIFPGPESDELFTKYKKSFKNFSRACLKSSRKTSNEYYFVGRGYEPGVISVESETPEQEATWDPCR